uniref:Uncharacterized protein n=1 Tax=Leersia perrieri TaxID=77586 RepID=A0A0D9WLU6_9ORYZ
MGDGPVAAEGGGGYRLRWRRRNGVDCQIWGVGRIGGSLPCRSVARASRAPLMASAVVGGGAGCIASVSPSGGRRDTGRSLFSLLAAGVYWCVGTGIGSDNMEWLPSKTGR